MNDKWLAKDLVVRLKKQYVAASMIQTGDIVVTSDDAWEVKTVHKNPNGLVTILDRDGSGFMEIGPAEVCVVVNRICFGR